VAVKRGPPPLDGDGPASKAVRRIIGAALGQLLANQPAAAAGDVEGVGSPSSCSGFERHNQASESHPETESSKRHVG
jgi:hypothetical protein